MNDIGAAPPTVLPRRVQDYLDETPVWADGTTHPVTPMTPMQARIWLLAAMGKFFEGMVVFMTGVALPLIAVEFGLGAAEHGLVTAISLLGILIGATVLGSLSDHHGRKKMFIFEMALFLAFLFVVCLAPSFPVLLVGLFGLGLALGCDYPTAHVIISESISSRNRGRLVLSAFGFQALGALFGTVVGYLILANSDDVSAWRWMYAVAIVPAIVVLIGRFFIPESPNWLMARGDEARASHAMTRLLNRTPRYPKEFRLRVDAPHDPHDKGTFSKLFKPKHRRATILASIPWFLQDLGTYGIGIFTPIILAQTVGQKKEHATNIADIIHNDMIAAKGAAVIDILLIVGIFFAIMLSDRVGRIPLQVIGFIGCAVGLAIAASSTFVDGTAQILMIFAGFMIFNFMTNIGPNAQTYVIAGEVFPTKIRASGAGFAASVGKVGAVLTAFLFPILLVHLGTTTLLFILVGTSLLGAVVTFAFRIETAGKNLADDPDGDQHHGHHHRGHAAHAKKGEESEVQAAQ